MPKKKFSETRVGQFLKEKAPKIIETVGDVLPDKGALGVVKRLIDNNTELSDDDKQTALMLLEADETEQKEITERWKSDNESESYLAKNARPIVLLASVGMLFLFIILDSFVGVTFDVKPEWISLYEVMMLTTIGGYFGARTVEKYHTKKFK